jgi:hypothetical protein
MRCKKLLFRGFSIFRSVHISRDSGQQARCQPEPKGAEFMTPQEQHANKVGANGGTVNTNGMPHQQAERIAAAVNNGKQGK